MNYTTEQKKLIFHAVRQYQMNRVSLNSKEYELCSDILNHLFTDVYTQQQEQPT